MSLIVQVQAEVDAVIGTGRMVTMKDRNRMPYTEATYMECQRLGNIALFLCAQVYHQGHRGRWVSRIGTLPVTLS